jgi:hypothetical protein
MQSLFTTILMSALALLAMPATGQSRLTDAAPAPESSLPAGVIVMWSGNLDTIPAGWALCDGSQNTPDLRNRFVLGAGTAEYTGSIGGSRTHQHREREHTHQIDPPVSRMRQVYGNSGYPRTRSRNHSYTVPEQTANRRSFKSGPAAVAPDSVSHLPPYYNIAFIMKL